jgi:hypothetical protein
MPGIASRLHDFFYGMTAYEFEKQAREMRGALEMIFMSVTLGDMIGLPVIPPIYALRLLPYAVPNIETWKRRAAHDRELCNCPGCCLHGM